MKGSQHWCTATWITALAREVLGDFDLDPFSNQSSYTYAAVQYTGPGGYTGSHPHGEFLDLDGFEEDWSGAVFFNNPWSLTKRAIRKAADEYASGRVEEMIGIHLCSMNAAYWPIVEAAPAHGYFRKRPAFVDPETGEEVRGNRYDVAATYWGRRPYRFASVFEPALRIRMGVAA